MMVREEYKEIGIGPRVVVIPKNWDAKIINNLPVKIADGNYASKYPKSEDFVENGVPFVSGKNIKNSTLVEEDLSFISKVKHEELKRGHLKYEDVLISTRGDIGKTGIVPRQFEGANINAQVVLLRSINIDKLNKKYLFYQIQSSNTKKQFNRLKTGSTIKQLPIRNVKKIKISVPPLPEQKKIASILSSVDKSIEKTDEVITETKELKKGLMQQLLTKGIGHSEFMEVNINGKTMKLPIDWDIKMLKDVTEINKNNISTSTSEDYTIEYIDISSINDIGKIAETTFYNYGNAPSRAKRLVNIDDVIVSTVRPYLKSFSIIEEDKENLVCSTGFAVLTPKLNMETEYIYYFAWSNHFVNYMKRLMRGTSYPAVNKSDVANTFIPVPPLSEQKKIASILSTVDAKIQKEEEYKAKLEQLKKGLMQKLLTGDIRVNIESEV